MFQLVTRRAGEPGSKYNERFSAKYRDLEELYPDVEREKFLDGVLLIFGGKQVAYLAFPKDDRPERKTKRWS